MQVMVLLWVGGLGVYLYADGALFQPTTSSLKGVEPLQLNRHFVRVQPGICDENEMSIQTLRLTNHPFSLHCFDIITVRRRTEDIKHVQLDRIHVFRH